MSKGPKPKPLAARFWPKVDLSNPYGCWTWMGGKNAAGYGTIGREGKGGWKRRHPVHRVSYELIRGPIPEGLVLDHLCRNPSCVNPGHLEAVTHRENLLRGQGPSAQHARKTHCPQGHPYSGVTKHGSRKCHECDRLHSQRYRDRKKARTKG